MNFKNISLKAALICAAIAGAQMSAVAADANGAEKPNPFRPNKNPVEKPLPLPQSQVPNNGIGNGLPPLPPGMTGVPGGTSTATPKYLGKINGISVYRADDGYKFDATATPGQSALPNSH